MPTFPQPERPGEEAPASERKERHLAICVDPSRFRVETMEGGAGFERLRLAHRALPELSLDDIDCTADFLGKRLSMPFLVSCMTGGSSGGSRVNRELAQAAAEAKVAFGLGSFRSLLRDCGRIADFRVKDILGELPLLANIGAVTLRDAGAPAVLEIVRAIEADALVVHLNPGQELFQPGGDRDFRGLKDSLSRLVEASTLPVIVKETGFGIAPEDVEALLASGVAWVDLAGAGGTNWAAVEAYRLDEGPLREAAADFDDWGWPTSLLLAALTDFGRRPAPVGQRLIASGGLRNGVDVAKAIALGAGLAAMALPLVRAVEGGGRPAATFFLERVATGLRAAMLLSGSRDLASLRRGILLFEPSFVAEARAFAYGEHRGGPCPQGVNSNGGSS
ncbi:MAG TPA: type 2 isopentenyl-diphosphate Delta-isomerase [Rectinemataceae bacterium]|nr:type 2 isopentenyl-diphosphate Delta-isomerase [Rectinemataceae bacterium]